MSRGLEFGKPEDQYRALIRLPDRGHSEYHSAGGPIEHLTHFKEAVLEIATTVNEGKTLPLDARWIPLELADMKMMERISFSRLPDPVVTAQWGYLSDGSVWYPHVPGEIDDDEWRWWQVSLMEPSLNLPRKHELICIETNSRFSGEVTLHRYDEHSEFDLFIVNPDELRNLQDELTRYPSFQR
jgi:hypothetical protein